VVPALAVPVALALAGCAGPDGAPATSGQVSSWMTSTNSGTSIGQVEADSRNVTLALSRHDPASQVRTACALLTTDALTGAGNLPSPDTALTDALNRAFQDAASAGNLCYQGASGNRALLRKSATERADFLPLATAVVERYQELTGKTPSTTTTLAPDQSSDPFAN
jgi:hypothetical protein